MLSKKFMIDAAERIGWTAASAAVSAAAVYTSKLPSEWIPIGTVLLTTLKTLIASRIGDKSSAALLPAPKETTA